MESILNVQQLLSSDKVKSRTQGLSRLNDYLTAQQPIEFSDSTASGLLEPLFSIILSDKKSFLKSQTSVVEDRLRYSADTAKKLLDVAINNLKTKSLRRVIYFLRDVLPVHNENALVAPVASPLIKCCLTITRNAAHIEHLSVSEAKVFALFHCEMLTKIVNSDSRPESGISSPTIMKRLPIYATDLLESLACLLGCKMTSPRNAYPQIAFHLLTFLKSYPNETSSHLYAFECLNVVIPVLLTTDFREGLNVVEKSFSSIPNLINCKDLRLKQSMLIYIMHSYHYFDILSSLGQLGGVTEELATLVYKSLLEDDSVEKVSVADLIYGPNDEITWFKLPYVKWNPQRDTLPWLKLQAMFRMLKIVTLSDHSDSDLFYQSKRPRRSFGISPLPIGCGAGYFLSHSWKMIDNNVAALYHIQCISIYIQLSGADLEQHEVSRISRFSLELAQSTDPEESSWGFLSLAFVVLRAEEHIVGYTWDIALQRLYDHKVGSGASLVLAHMLRSTPERITDARLESLVKLFDAKALAVSAGTLTLASLIVELKGKLSDSSAKTMQKKILDWIFDGINSILLSGTASEDYFLFTSDFPTQMAELLIRLCGMAVSIPTVTKYYGQCQQHSLIEEENKEALDFRSLKRINFESYGQDPDQPSEHAVHIYHDIVDIDIQQSVFLKASALLRASCESLPNSSNQDSICGHLLQYLSACYVFFQHVSLYATNQADELADEMMHAAEVVEKAVTKKSFIGRMKDFVNASSYLIVSTRRSPYRLHRVVEAFESMLTHCCAEPMNSPALFPRDINSLLSSTTFTSNVLLYDFHNTFEHKWWPTKERFTSPVEFLIFVHSFAKFSKRECIDTEAKELIRALGENILASFEWQKSELGIICAVELIKKFSYRWVGEAVEASALRSDAGDVLKWVLKVVVSNSSQSLKSRESLASFINGALHLHYDKNLAETYLHLVSGESSILSYSIAHGLQSLFSHAPAVEKSVLYAQLLQLNEQLGGAHDVDIFKAFILVNCALNINNFAGCIYNLLELAHTKPQYMIYLNDSKNMGGLAAFCVENLKKELSFQEIGDLFGAIMKEVIYYWIYFGHPIRKFPYQIFGFASFEEFSDISYEEIASNLIVLQPEELEAKLEDFDKERSMGAIISMCIHKAVAYDMPAFESESFMIKQLGNSKFRALLRERIVEITSELLQIVSVSNEYEGLLPDTPYRAVSRDDFMESINGICARVGINVREIWHASTFVYIARKLLLKNPVSALQAALNLRRCKILVEITEFDWRSGYPLELLFKGIIPMLFNKLSSNEANDILSEFCALLKNADFELLPKVGFELLSELTLQNKSLATGVIYALADILSQTPESQFSKFMIAMLRNYVESDTHPIFESPDYAEVMASPTFIHYGLLSDTLTARMKSIYLKVLSDGMELSSLSSMNSKIPNDVTINLLELAARPKSDLSDSLKTWIARLVGTTMLGSRLDLKRVTKECQEHYFQGNVKMQVDYDRPYKGIGNLIASMIANADFSDMGYIEHCLRQLRLYLDATQLRMVTEACPEYIVACTQYSLHGLRCARWNREYGSGRSQEWLIETCTLLLKESELPTEALLPLIYKITHFAEQLFPFLAHQMVIKSRQESLVKALQAGLRRGDKQMACLVINTLLYLRYQGATESPDRLFELDLEEIAQSAHSHDMNKTAMMLLEMAWSQDKSLGQSGQFLLGKVCATIDDPDIYYGVSRQPSIEEATRHQKSRLWNKLSYESALYDFNLSAYGYKEKGSDLSEPLAAIGMNGLSKLAADTNRAKLKKSVPESLWKLQQWDLPESLGTSSNDLVFNMLKALNKTHIGYDNLYMKAFDGLMANEEALYGALAIASEIEQVTPIFNIDLTEQRLAQLDRLCEFRRNCAFEEYENLLQARSITWQSLCRKYMNEDDKLVDQLFSFYALSSIEFAVEARQNGQIQKALASVVGLDSSMVNFRVSDNVRKAVTVASNIEMAKILWANGDESNSIGLLKQVIEQYDMTMIGPDKDTAIKYFEPVDVYSDLAQWSATSRHEDPDDIRRKYLDYTVEQIERGELVTDANGRARLYHVFATFSDEQAQSRSNLEALQNAVKLRDRKKKELDVIRNIASKGTVEEKKWAAKMYEREKKVFDADNSECENLVELQQGMTLNCIRYYLKSIIESDEFRGDISRFVALWLANSGFDIINDTIKEMIHKIPTRKLVPWVNQLSSRLIKGSTKFLRRLNDVLVRVCEQHPYHCLYQIYSVKMLGGGDHEVAKKPARATRNGDGNKYEGMNKLRSEAARDLWNVLMKRKKVHNHLLSALDVFCDNAKELAHGISDPARKKSLQLKDIKVKKDEDRRYRGPRTDLSAEDWRRRKAISYNYWQVELKDSGLPCPTMHLEIRASGDYSDVPTMTKMEPKVTIASGLSAPKIVNIWSSDGTRCKLLMKGGDDLRQDAVMEQVFDQANQFFQLDEKAKKRSLKIRIYKVITLDYNSGIIEFVSNTMPLIDVLRPVHRKYRPQDMTDSEARKLLGVQTNHEKKQRAYTGITRKIEPCLRYFFFEKFQSPDDWFQARVNYSRTTAVISILGYILGVGDRHCNNILLDTQNGDVVHIDLGIAFDQGKMLPVPETIPFRLSRDVVDGMGICGVEGIFRMCCELTLEVLRGEKESITAILNVLRYDPLYQWTVSPLKKRKFQQSLELASVNAPSGVVGSSSGEDEEEEEGEADRAITVVQSKLLDKLSVEAVVRELIHDAADPKNLALLFQGWSAFY
ncbi:hypothetical protein TRVA0_022S00914 [Trichomonascus vanleenenianus]|uniref:DNA-binding protein kinase TEL1 n=1 Tax=Trichomonascus vanleenenianus TaxID=2268995 RepID=UPI003ECAD075